MKHAVWLAGMLGLIALAFGTASAVAVARLIVILGLTVALVVTVDILTYGAVSDALIPRHQTIVPRITTR